MDEKIKDVNSRYAESVLEKEVQDDNPQPWRDDRMMLEVEDWNTEPHKWVVAVIKKFINKKTGLIAKEKGTAFLLKHTQGWIIMTSAHNLMIPKKYKNWTKKFVISFPAFPEKKDLVLDSSKDDLDMFLCKDPLYDSKAKVHDIGYIVIKTGFGHDDGILYRDFKLAGKKEAMISGFPKPWTETSKDNSGMKTLHLYGLNGKNPDDWPQLCYGTGSITHIGLDRVHHTVDTERGNSGSPIMVYNGLDWEVFAVHAFGHDHRKFNSGTAISKDFWHQILMHVDKVSSEHSQEVELNTESNLTPSASLTPPSSPGSPVFDDLRMEPLSESQEITSLHLINEHHPPSINNGFEVQR